MDYPKIYKKSIKGVVGGRNLVKRGGAYVEETFVLKGDPATAELDKITVEIEDELSEKYFVKNNKKTIANGYLIETDESGGFVDRTNSASDGQLKDMLKEPFAKLKIRLNDFTSPVPLQRLLDIAIKDNKPIKTIEMIKKAKENIESAA